MSGGEGAPLPAPRTAEGATVAYRTLKRVPRPYAAHETANGGMHPHFARARRAAFRLVVNARAPAVRKRLDRARVAVQRARPAAAFVRPAHDATD